MPSPFPGMDPYLEAHWRDVHARLVLYSSDAIQEQLPPELHARVEERVVLEADVEKPLEFYPDFRVVEYPKPSQPHPPQQVAAATAQPEIVEVDLEPLTEGFIQIIDSSSGNRIVTFLEVLSPSNKVSGADRKAYLNKQREIRDSEANLVEIDLVRTGLHTVAFPLVVFPRSKWTPYYVCVRRATEPGRAEVYRIPRYHRLPVVKVPLRPTDADVVLDLQAIIEQVYQRGRYGSSLNYNQEPHPPFRGAEADQLDQFLREKGVRTLDKPKRKPRPRAR